MKIGTRVKVVDLKFHCKDFHGYFNKMGFNGANIEREIEDLEEISHIKFVVFSIIKDSRGKFYGIIDKKGNQFLFQKEGLQKIKKSKKVEDEPIQEQEEVKEKPFPKVMKHRYTDLHVFFENNRIGQIIIPNDKWKLGYISNGWMMPAFEDIKEPITITFK